MTAEDATGVAQRDLQLAARLHVSPQVIESLKRRNAPLPEDATADLAQLAGWLGSGITVDSSRRFPQSVLNAGFIVGLALSGLALLCTVGYSLGFLVDTASSVSALVTKLTAGDGTEPTFQLAILAQTMVVKMSLLSCGVLVGAVMAFLGFSLFLIGIRGAMDVEVQGSDVRAKLVHVAPGTFVVLVAALLVGFCCTREMSLQFGTGAEPDPAPPAPNGSEDPEETNGDMSAKKTVGAIYAQAFFSGESVSVLDKVLQSLRNIETMAQDLSAAEEAIKPELEEAELEEAESKRKELEGQLYEALTTLKEKTGFLAQVYKERKGELDQVGKTLVKAGQKDVAEGLQPKLDYLGRLHSFYVELQNLNTSNVNIKDDTGRTRIKAAVDVAAKLITDGKDLDNADQDNADGE